MEQVLDALRRIISRWVKTVTPLIEDAHVGDTHLKVRNTHRFRVGEEVVVRGATKYEKPPRYRIKKILDDHTLVMSSPLVLKNWTVNEGSVVQKLIHGNTVDGIYFGDPENIPMFPAITINGISEETPEWLTLDSVKDVFNVEIGVYVDDSTMEEGYRFLLRLSKLIKWSLMNNIFPLVNDYEQTALTADANYGDEYLKVEDSSIFEVGNVILIESPYKAIEHKVDAIVDAHTIKLYNNMPTDFLVSDGTGVIRVNRLLFNSYPKSINYGKIHKGSLCKAAVIDWFGWECVVPPHEGQAWIDPQIH